MTTSESNLEFTIWIDIAFSHPETEDSFDGKTLLQGVQPVCRWGLLEEQSAKWKVDSKDWNAKGSSDKNAADWIGNKTTRYCAQKIVPVESVDEAFIRKIASTGSIGFEVAMSRKRRKEKEKVTTINKDDQDEDKDVAADGAIDRETNTIVTSLDILPLLVQDRTRGIRGESVIATKKQRYRFLRASEKERQKQQDEKLKVIAAINEKSRKGFEALLECHSPDKNRVIKSRSPTRSKYTSDVDMDDYFPSSGRKKMRTLSKNEINEESQVGKNEQVMETSDHNEAIVETEATGDNNDTGKKNDNEPTDTNEATALLLCSISDTIASHEFLSLDDGVTIVKIEFGVNLSRPLSTENPVYKKLNPFVMTLQPNERVEICQAEFSLCGERRTIPWIRDRAQTEDSHADENTTATDKKTAENKTDYLEPKTASVVWFLSDMESLNSTLFARRSDDTADGIHLLQQDDVHHVRELAISGERYREKLADQLKVQLNSSRKNDSVAVVSALLMSNSIHSTPTLKGRVDLPPYVKKREHFHNLVDMFQSKRIFGRFILRPRANLSCTAEPRQSGVLHLSTLGSKEMYCGEAEFHCPELRKACGPFSCPAQVQPPYGHSSGQFPAINVDKEVYLSAEMRVGHSVFVEKKRNGHTEVEAMGKDRKAAQEENREEGAAGEDDTAHKVTKNTANEDTEKNAAGEDGAGTKKGDAAENKGNDNASPKAVFTKLVICAPYFVDVEPIFTLIANHNSEAVNVSVIGSKTYLLSHEQKLDTELDIMTGFTLFDTHSRLIVVEGRGDFPGMQNLRESVMLLKDEVPECKIAYNSAVCYSRRQYGDFNIVLKTVKLRNLLGSTLIRAEIHTAERDLNVGVTKQINMSKEHFDHVLCLSASDLSVASAALQQISAVQSHVQSLAQMTAPKLLFPSTQGVRLIELLYGTFVSERELEGTPHVEFLQADQKVVRILESANDKESDFNQPSFRTEDGFRISDLRRKTLATSDNPAVLGWLKDMKQQNARCGVDSSDSTAPPQKRREKKIINKRIPSFKTLVTAGRNRNKNFTQEVIEQSPDRSIRKYPEFLSLCQDNAGNYHPYSTQTFGTVAVQGEWFQDWELADDKKIRKVDHDMYFDPPYIETGEKLIAQGRINVKALKATESMLLKTVKAAGKGTVSTRSSPRTASPPKTVSPSRVASPSRVSSPSKPLSPSQASSLKGLSSRARSTEKKPDLVQARVTRRDHIKTYLGFATKASKKRLDTTMRDAGGNLSKEASKKSSPVRQNVSLIGGNGDGIEEKQMPTLLKSTEAKGVLEGFKSITEQFIKQKPKKKFQTINALPKKRFGGVLPIS